MNLVVKERRKEEVHICKRKDIRKKENRHKDNQTHNRIIEVY